jgi:hypothetical protein
VDYAAAVESLIRHAVRWLKQSAHTNTVQFVVYYADDLEDWDAAMNRSLGRSYVAAGSDRVLESLCQELNHLAFGHHASPLTDAVRPLAEALARRETLCIETVCVFGRKLVEVMLAKLLPSLGLREGPVLLNNIEELRKSSRVAPWICSYMHSLRVFGNETVHTRAGESGYLPARLDRGDLVSALCAIRALLSFWNDISSSFPEMRVSFV